MRQEYPLMLTHKGSNILTNQMYPIKFQNLH